MKLSVGQARRGRQCPADTSALHATGPRRAGCLDDTALARRRLHRDHRPAGRFGRDSRPDDSSRRSDDRPRRTTHVRSCEILDASPYGATWRFLNSSRPAGDRNVDFCASGATRARQDSNRQGTGVCRSDAERAPCGFSRGIGAGVPCRAGKVGVSKCMAAEGGDERGMNKLEFA